MLEKTFKKCCCSRIDFYFLFFVFLGSLRLEPQTSRPCLKPTLSTLVCVSSGAVWTPAVTLQSSEGSRTPNCEKTEGGAPVTSARKWQFSTQLSRNKETTCSRVDDNLTEHQIFASIQGNQFKRNGLGNFGTFFYWRWLRRDSVAVEL